MEVVESVPAEDEGDADVRTDLGAERAHRVDGVGGAGPPEFHVPRLQPGTSLDGELDHAQPVGRLGAARTLLVRRQGGWDETDLVQALALAHLLGRAEMAQVNRVERAAEQADAAARRRTCPRRVVPAQSRTCPLPRTRYLYVVSSRRPMGPRA